VFQAEHFRELLDESWIGLEKPAIGFMQGAAALQAGAAVLHGIDTFHKGFQAAFTFGLGGSPASSLAQALSMLAGAASTQSSIFQTLASYERRKEEWQLQKTLAEHDIRIRQQRMTLAVDHARIIDQERFVASMQVEHADSTMEFLANKFTNADLFEWMSGVLERVYAYFLQQATAMAQLAENQLAFERQEMPPEFVQADYWQAQIEAYAGVDPETPTPDRRGLTGSVRLLQDMYKLDQYAFETNKRKLQLSDRMSAERPLSLRDQFADQWYTLHNPKQTTTQLAVTFKTAHTDFPPNVEELCIQQVLLAFVRVEGQSFEVASVQLRFTPHGDTVAVGGAAGGSVDGIISTRRSNAGSWTALIGKSPVGMWELAIPNTEEMKNRFKNAETDDILPALTYAGRTPTWPV
jgi:hypothetical protein